MRKLSVLLLILGACTSASTDKGSVRNGSGGSGAAGSGGTGGQDNTAGMAGSAGATGGSGGSGANDSSGGTGGSGGSQGTGGSGAAGSSGGAGSGGSGGGAGSGGAGGSGDAGSGGSGAGSPDGGVTGPLTGTGLVVAGTFDDGSHMSLFAIDFKTGALTSKGPSVAGSNGADYLWMHPSGKFMYANNETDPGGATAMAVGPDGSLTKINSQTVGTRPAAVTVSKTGKFLFSADYEGGKVQVLPIADDGKLGAPTASLDAGSEVHFAIDDGVTGNYLFVVCAGSNYIAQYKLDTTTGKLTPNNPATIAVQGSPRHMAFSTNGKFAYVTHQGAAAVTTLSYDATTGLLSSPKDTNAPRDGTHIVAHPGGDFLYLIGRGSATVTVFKGASTGQLTTVGSTPTPGSYDGALTKDGRFLLVSGQRTVRSFAIDQTTGLLTAAGMGQTEEQSWGVTVTF